MTNISHTIFPSILFPLLFLFLNISSFVQNFQEGLFSVLATIDAPDFTFSDTTVSAGMTYRYRIQIQHEQSSSDFSNLATFVAAGLPAQPAAVTLVSQPPGERKELLVFLEFG